MTFDIVTGALGFIGSHLMAALRKAGRDIKAWDMEHDVRQPLFPLVGCDTVYHLAALSNIIPSISHPRDYYETNITGTLNILEAARLGGVRKFIYAASASCYGLDGEYCDEDDICSPQYPYALTKYLGEQLVLHYGKVYGIEVVSLRIFNAYGPNSLTKSAYGAMFNTFLAQKANGKPLTIIGDGTQGRDFVYVDDVVSAFQITAEKGNGIYNCGTGIPTPIKQVAEIIGGERCEIQERYGEPRCIYANNSKLRRIGWSPKTDIGTGVKIMMENLDYWKGAKVWDPSSIEMETATWQKYLKH